MTALKPMKSAPTDGTVITVKMQGVGFRRVRYVSCAWMRDDDNSITDCWRTHADRSKAQDFELSEALGWRPASH